MPPPRAVIEAASGRLFAPVGTISTEGAVGTKGAAPLRVIGATEIAIVVGTGRGGAAIAPLHQIGLLS